MATKANQKFRLEDLVVEEVSIVDRPANQRRFLTVKNEDGMNPKGAEIVKDENGNLVTEPNTAQTPATASSDPPADPSTPSEPVGTGLAESFKVAGEGLEKIEKRLTIGSDQRRDVFRSISDVMNRLSSVMNVADFAASEKAGEDASKLVPILAEELSEVAKVVAAVAKTLGGKSVKKDDAVPAPQPTTVVPAPAPQPAPVQPETVPVVQGVDAIRNLVEGLEKASRVDAGEGQVLVSKADFDGLMTNVHQLTEVMKRQGKELRTLRNTPMGSNVIPIDKGSDDQRREDDDETSWPLDMNAEKNPGTVDKAVSFLNP